MDTKTPVVAIIEDDPPVLQMLDILLKSEGYDTVIYENPKPFLSDIKNLNINCILSDVCMPGLTGLEMQQKLKEFNIVVPVIFLTGKADVKMAVQAMRDGAVEFLEKPVVAETLFECLKDALTIDAELTERTIAAKEFSENYQLLTKREKEVLALIVEGSTNKSIGAQLNIAESTVEIHRSRVMKKSNAKNCAHLIRMVLTSGIGLTPETHSYQARLST